MITTTPYYDKTYLHDAMENLGSMFDYAINDCHYDAEDFFDLFIASGVAWNIELGNPKFLARMSGVETTREVLRRTKSEYVFTSPTFREHRSPEYWLGWGSPIFNGTPGELFHSLGSNGLVHLRFCGYIRPCTKRISSNWIPSQKNECLLSTHKITCMSFETSENA